MQYDILRGYLSFMVLFFIDKNKEMSGNEIVNELEKRIERRINPGTIYPSLKRLKENNLILIRKKIRKEIYYSLTQQGKRELEKGVKLFNKLFYDVK